MQAPSYIHRFSFAPFGDEKKPLPAAKAPEPEPVAAPAPPPPPTFSEQEVQAAQKKGYDQGHGEGIKAAEARINKETAAREDATKSLLDVIANRITIAAEAYQAQAKEQKDISAKLVLAIARKLAGDALKREPYATVESLITECSAMITSEPKIVITVSPARADGLKQRTDSLKPLLQGFSGEIEVAQDEKLGAQDCRVEWKNGHAERNQEALWNEIETVILQKPLNS